MFVPIIITSIVIIGVLGLVVYVINKSKYMEPNQSFSTGGGQSKTGVLNFFFNLGAIVALGFVLGNLISLLFTIIDRAYPVINNYAYYGYNGSSISFPVASLIVVFPLYILFMWLLERSYKTEPEKRNNWFKRFLNYVTLFVAGLSFVGDLIMVIYYFIDGQELTSGFIMKALSILVIALAVFFYYVSDLLGRLDSKSRKIWTIVSAIIIILAIIWGFSVLGSPRTQRLYKYDQQKVSDLANISNQVTNYYSAKGAVPVSFAEMSALNYYLPQTVDQQTQKPYEYQKTGNLTYKLCAEFNKASDDKYKPYSSDSYPNNMSSWSHPVGRYCFDQTINPTQYPPMKVLPL